jgi:protein gp37
VGKDTGIQWTDHTFNPWRGCQKVSPGCQHCYAETLSARNPSVLGEWGPNGRRAIASESYWRQPLAWDRAAARDGVRRRVFCASLADVFEDRPELTPSRCRRCLMSGSASPLRTRPVRTSPNPRSLRPDWVIIGGESGPKARSCNVVWIRSLLRQCREAGTAAFCKQLGSQATRLFWEPCGTEEYDVPLELKDPKGGDPEEWDADLRVREFPTPQQVSP